MTMITNPKPLITKNAYDKIKNSLHSWVGELQYKTEDHALEVGAFGLIYNFTTNHFIERLVERDINKRHFNTLLIDLIKKKYCELLYLCEYVGDRDFKILVTYRDVQVVFSVKDCMLGNRRRILTPITVTRTSLKMKFTVDYSIIIED